MIEIRPDQPSELRRLETANALRLGEARLLLALAMVLVVLFDSSAKSLGLVVAVLVAHVLYGSALMLLARRRTPTRIFKHAHWADAACYLVVVGLAGGYESKFFLALLFPILVVSLHTGFHRGVTFAALWSLSFTAVGALARGPHATIHIAAAELWPVATLLLLGVLVARWGSAEYTLLRRLAFLNDLKRLATPRYGIAHALSQLAALLRAYLHAERCIVLLKDPESDGYLTSEANLPIERALRGGGRIGPEAAEPLVRVAPGVAMIYMKRRHSWRRTIARAYDHASLQPSRVAPSELDALANLLETDSFISLPLCCRDQPAGRLYASSSRQNFVLTELEFLRQASGHASLVIDTIQLVELLANDKATQERQRISRDLHDGTIQPYIGLKLGLEALRRRMAAADPLLGDVVDLTRMAEEGIAELRRYVNGLRDGRTKRDGESLLSAIRRLTEKFNEFYGVKVQLIADTDPRLSEPMCDEVLNIVREGLANIRRHTAAASATICLREGDGRLVVEFLNEAAPQSRSVPLFVPRSLNERAAELGGIVNVETRDSGQTRVAVEIPV